MLLKKGHNEKLDVWTVGVILFELCTGKTPFSDPELKQGSKEFNSKLEKNILTKQPVYPTYLSQDLILLLSQMLKKNHRERI